MPFPASWRYWRLPSIRPQGQPAELAVELFAELTVELVVEPLRHAEELVVAVHHEPAGVPPRAELVAEDRSQHLRDTTPLGGRIDMPEPTPIQEVTAASHGLLEQTEICLGDDAVEPVRFERGHVDDFHRILPRRGAPDADSHSTASVTAVC